MDDDAPTCAIFDDGEPRLTIEQQRQRDNAEEIERQAQRVIDNVKWDRFNTFYDRRGNCIRPFRIY